MKHRYEVYIYNGAVYRLRFWTNDIDEACDKADEIEKTSKEEFDGTAIYDTKLNGFVNIHRKGTCHVLSK